MCALSYLLGVPVTFPATAFFKKLKRCSLYNQVNFWCIYYIFCINNCLICWFHAYFFKLKWHVAFESIAYNCFQRSTQMYACTLRTCVGAFSKKYRCLSAQTLSERVCSWCDEETVVWCCETIDVWPLFFFLIFFVGLRLWSQEERKRLWILLHHVHLITVLCLQCIFNQATILLLVYSGNELLNCLLVALLWLLNKPLYTVLLKLLGECYYHAWARCPSSIPLQSWIGVE